MDICRTCPLCRENDILVNAGHSCVSCSKLERFNRELDEAKIAFDRILEQRRAYFEEMNQKVDPIQRLPTELVSSIFVHCLPRPHSLDVFQDVPLHDQVQYANRPVQYLLGSVCRFWRQVVWSMPRLWNILWLSFTADTTKRDIQWVVDCLSRSSPLPLYVRMFWIQDGQHRGLPAWNCAETIIDYLDQNANRFRVLSLCLIGEHLSCFGRHSGAANSLLERLDIEVLHDQLEGEFEDYYEFQLARKPSPTYVLLKDMRIEAVDIHWSNVTHFEIGNLCNHEAVIALQFARQLQHFKVKIIRCNHIPGPDAPTSVTHNSLKTLQVVWVPNQDLLHRLTCPALEKFMFDMHNGSLIPVISFLRQSNCPLKELALEELRGPNINLVSLLRLTPLLTHLSLLRCFSHQLEESLTNVRRSAVEDSKFLPCLCSFQMTTYLTSRTLLPITLELVASDDHVRRPWSSIKVVFLQYGQNKAPFFDRTILSQIVRFIEKGVEIEVQDCEGLDLIYPSRQLHGI